MTNPPAPPPGPPQPAPRYEPFIPASALPNGGMPGLPPGYIVGPRPVVWHSPPVLWGVLAAAVLALVLMIVGFALSIADDVNIVFGVFLMIDLAGIAITALIMAVVERRRRSIPARLAAPTNRRVSVFAILGLMFSLAITFTFLGTGLGELTRISGGLRAQYINLALPYILVGVPWVLGTVFGAWGYRPGGNRVTNVLALVAVGLGVLMMVPVVVGTLALATGAAS